MKHFINGLYRFPTQNKRYTWKSICGNIPVYWVDGSWYSLSGDKLGDNLVLWWR